MGRPTLFEVVSAGYYSERGLDEPCLGGPEEWMRRTAWAGPAANWRVGACLTSLPALKARRRDMVACEFAGGSRDVDAGERAPTGVNKARGRQLGYIVLRPRPPLHATQLFIIVMSTDAEQGPIIFDSLPY